LRLNKKSTKSKEKTVEEKKESGMKTVLNAFKRNGREKEARGRGGRGGRGRGAGAYSTQTPNITQSKLQSSPTTTQHNSINTTTSTNKTK
jgi:hypothetical protein